MTTQNTELERIISLENDFNEITEINDLSKIINNFEINKTVINYNYIIDYINLTVDFNEQYNYNTTATNFYLIDKLGKIILSYTYTYDSTLFTYSGTFSTYDEYNLGLNFASLSEEQEFLNNFEKLKIIGTCNINLLQEPIVNVILALTEVQNYLLYYMVSKKYVNIKKPCKYNNYYLVGFIFKTIIV